MWHEARKQEKVVRGLMVDMAKRAERRRNHHQRLRSEPHNFLCLFGKKVSIHVDENLAQQAGTCMMPWSGDASIEIDRFDGRSHLDHFSQVADSASAVYEEQFPSEDERVKCMYERYRTLVQYDVLGIRERESLQQIDLEEKFGSKASEKLSASNSATASTDKKKNLAAAIGYNYGGNTTANAVSNKTTDEKPEVEETGDNDSDDSDLDFLDLDILLNIDDLSTEQHEYLRKVSVNYGMDSKDFIKYLGDDKKESDERREFHDYMEAKSQFVGRKGRKERMFMKAARLRDYSKRLPGSTGVGEYSSAQAAIGATFSEDGHNFGATAALGSTYRRNSGEPGGKATDEKDATDLDNDDALVAARIVAQKRAAALALSKIKERGGNLSKKSRRRRSSSSSSSSNNSVTYNPRKPTGVKQKQYITSFGKSVDVPIAQASYAPRPVAAGPKLPGDRSKIAPTVNAPSVQPSKSSNSSKASAVLPTESSKPMFTDIPIALGAKEIVAPKTRRSSSESSNDDAKQSRRSRRRQAPSSHSSSNSSRSPSPRNESVDRLTARTARSHRADSPTFPRDKMKRLGNHCDLPITAGPIDISSSRSSSSSESRHRRRRSDTSRSASPADDRRQSSSRRAFASSDKSRTTTRKSQGLSALTKFSHADIMKKRLEMAIEKNMVVDKKCEREKQRQELEKEKVREEELANLAAELRRKQRNRWFEERTAADSLAVRGSPSDSDRESGRGRHTSRRSPSPDVSFRRRTSHHYGGRRSRSRSRDRDRSSPRVDFSYRSDRRDQSRTSSSRRRTSRSPERHRSHRR